MKGALAIAVFFLASASLRAATVAGCQSLRLHGQAAAAQACFQSLAASADPYLKAEGDWGLADGGADSSLYAEANGQFREAVAQNDANPLYRVRWGRLLQQRFNDTDADALFHEALARDPKNAAAYLGLALVSADGFDGKALVYAHQAVELDPRLAEARVLLANLALEDSDPSEAASDADAALAAQPDDLDAMAIHAAIDVLAERPDHTWLDKIFALNPAYGAADAAIADQLVMNRRYDEAVTYYRKAIALDPRLWSARSQLGITLMRLGQEDEPRRQLELCYDNGYRDASTVNSLRLLDTYKNFDVIRTPTIILKLDKKESALLAPYFESVIQHAMAVYSVKYQMTLPAPVQVEAYPNHEDFAVRSLGMPGLGALGVTFGEVVAMDSPSARAPGEFNWASTLWHEMDHVYVLTASNHLVPRWFAEGLAVHEETQANPEWGDRITPEVLSAIHDHQLLPVVSLDRGFIHPSNPDQVTVSYYQAGRICDFIQARWGAQKLVDMVRAFSVPTSTAAVIQQQLSLAPTAFDTQFETWLHQDLGATVDNFDLWHTQLKALVQAAQAQPSDPATVIQLGEKVRALYPDFIYAANPYGYLAAAYRQQGNLAQAEATLTEYEKRGGDDPTQLKELAGLEAAQGETAAAAATLDRINYIYPLDPDVHEKLGALYLQLNNAPGAIREYTAAAALHPLDQAGAEYHLAEAYFAAGQLDPAQDHVIAALVAAHDYRPAQDLLIKIMAAKQKSNQPRRPPPPSARR